MNRTKLIASIQAHEGFSALPYEDAGGIAIGYGRNLTFSPLTYTEAVYLMNHPIDVCLLEAAKIVTNFGAIGDARQNVIIEMCYNLGGYAVVRFKKMCAAIEANDFEEAAKQILDSKWATQVGKRATTLAEQMRTGAFTT